MQFRIYDRQTLAYKDGGFVASYTIDDDYIVNNNSKITIVKELNDSVVVGDTIALIETSGAFHKGTITNFDNADFSILYKSDKELFNDNMLNPLATEYAQNEELRLAFDMDFVANILYAVFAETGDWAKQMPLKIITEGSPVRQIYNAETHQYQDNPINMLWNWSNPSINIVDWLVDLFERYNVSLNWNIDFNIANSIICEVDENGKLKHEINLVCESEYVPISTISIDKEKYLSKNLPNEATFLGIKDNENIWYWAVSGIGLISLEDYGIYLDNSKYPNRVSFKVTQTEGDLLIINNRSPYYVVTLSALANSGKLIKDNVANQTITYTEREAPEATVCVLINKETKEVVEISSGVNLLNPAQVKERTILNYNEQYGYVQEQSSLGTNVSGYIKVDRTKPYVFSFYNNDGLTRSFIYYDKDKKALAVQPYNVEVSEGVRLGINVTIPDIENIYYVRINYYYASTELQFEQAEHQTPPAPSPFDEFNYPARYYLINVSGVDMITMDETNKNRVFPVKTKYVEYDITGEDTTEEQVAYDTLIPSKFNQAIEVQISSDSKMFDFETATFGDSFKIINEQGTINTNYTGRKQSSDSKWVTLYFGLGRQNYTSLSQIKWRKSKYQVLYNQGK